MKALIIGGAGFVGGYLIRELDSAGQEVFATCLENENISGNCSVRTLNILDADAVSEVIGEIKPDAYIVSDPGVICRIKEIIPDGEIHLSTQASTVNAAACRFWYSAGLKRIVLARECSKDEIKAIKGDFGNIIKFLNLNKSFAVCMYTNNSQKAYKFINWIDSPNVFVNTGINGCKDVTDAENEYYNFKYVLHEDVF